MVSVIILAHITPVVYNKTELFDTIEKEYYKCLIR